MLQKYFNELDIGDEFLLKNDRIRSVDIFFIKPGIFFVFQLIHNPIHIGFENF